MKYGPMPALPQCPLLFTEMQHKLVFRLLNPPFPKLPAGAEVRHPMRPPQRLYLLQKVAVRKVVPRVQPVRRLRP